MWELIKAPGMLDSQMHDEFWDFCQHEAESLVLLGLIASYEQYCNIWETCLMGGEL